jgi:hypothetical protein
MTQTTKVSITLDTATAIANWMREDLDYAAEQAADKRTEAHMLRKQANALLAENPEDIKDLPSASSLLNRANICDQRADMHDAHFKKLEAVCIELTRAGV